MAAFIERPTYIDAIQWTGSNFQEIIDLFSDISDHFGINQDGDLNYTGSVIPLNYYIVRRGLSLSWRSEEDLLSVYQAVPNKNQKFTLDTAV